VNLQDLLTYVAVDLLHDRTDLISGDPDDLWSDRVIVGFLNEAQRILARRAWLLKDVGNATAGLITLQTGVDTYQLHKSVLRVYSAKPTDSDVPLGRTTFAAISYRNGVDTNFFDLNAAFTRTPGRPTAFATDGAFRTLKLNRKPDADSNGLVLELEAAHLPITPFPIPASSAALSNDQLALEPETPEDYHMWLGEYAAGRCLTLPHVDADRKVEGRAMLATFNSNVAEARRDRERAEYAPGQFCFNSTTAYND
jgi:hypothetical protein